MRHLYGADADQGIDLVSIMIKAVGDTGKVAPIKKGADGKSTAGAAGKGKQIYWESGLADTPVYAHSKLGKGSAVSGPALIEGEFGIMAAVPVGHELILDTYGSGIIKAVSR